MPLTIYVVFSNVSGANVSTLSRRHPASDADCEITQAALQVYDITAPSDDVTTRRDINTNVARECWEGTQCTDPVPHVFMEITLNLTGENHF